MTDKTEAPELKPLDLQVLLKHAFMAGRLSGEHPVEPTDDAWFSYDPTGNAAYKRVLTILTQFDESRTDAICAEVKPLEWRNSYGVMRADTPLGTWFIKGAIAEFRSMDFSMAPGGDMQTAIQQKHNERSLQVIATRPASEVHQEGYDAGKAAGRAEVLEEPSLAIFCHPKDDPENEYTIRFIGKERAEQGMRKLAAAGWVPLDFREYSTISDEALDDLINKEAGK